MNILLFLLLLLAAPPAFAATIPATSCQQSAVSDAITAAADGDTVTVPAGDCSWTGNLAIDKAITLQGAGDGTGSTIGCGNCATRITVDRVSILAQVASGIRISGFQFTATSGCSGFTQGGASMFLWGVLGQVRLDHNSWITPVNCPMLQVNSSYGVADHNTFTRNAGLTAIPISIFDYSGDTHGDNAWAAPDNMGAAQAFFFEDNTFINNASGYTLADGWRGFRAVWRHNTFMEMGVGGHGTESGGRDRGVRLMEVYENDFWVQTVDDAGPNGSVQMRGGTGVVYNNRIHGRNGKSFLLARMDNFRRAGQQHTSGPWGACGVQSATFTRSGGTATVTTTIPVWTSDGSNCAGAFSTCQLTVGGTTNYNGTHAVTAWLSPTQVQFSVGGTPGAESGTVAALWDGNTDATGYPCMDQVGSGPSVLFTDPFNTADVIPKQAAANASSPVYCWGNTSDLVDGGATTAADCTSTSDSIVVTRDLINGTAKPGYTPFTYPHPLAIVGPDTTSPTDPSNLVATSNSSYNIHLVWTGSTDNVGVVRYEMYRGDAICQNFILVGYPTTPQFDDFTGTPNTQQCYRTRAWDGHNFSANYTNTAIATTIAPRTVVLSFVDNSPNAQNAAPETAFQLERCAGASCSLFNPIAILDPNVTTYVDTQSPAPVAGYRTSAVPYGSGYSNIVYTSPGTPGTILVVSPPSLIFSSSVGTNPPPTTFSVSNIGTDIMPWTASKDASWISSITPSNWQDNAIVTVTINTTGLASGTYQGTITITAPGATGSPETIGVTLNLSPVTAPARGSSGRVR